MVEVAAVAAKASDALLAVAVEPSGTASAELPAAGRLLRRVDVEAAVVEDDPSTAFELSTVSSLAFWVETVSIME